LGNGDWLLKNVNGTYTLHGSNKFLVAMNDGSGWTAGNDLEELSYGMHVLCWPDSCVKLIQIDAQPVPIPAAVYLLGAGLLGMAGFRKRK